ncbi:post-transcriptional regulator [Thalassobacillus hwangdonensis]|uniref:Post-transcriptional regulator n=1 Tax=Thalassobacillus hwangdonensis TaxID=546108 RepID=A0ABW3L0K1_9BACI
MELVQTVSQWKAHVSPLLQSKADEFKIMGYPKTTKQDVWECLRQKVWKGDPEKRLYEITQEIMRLNTTTYISYLTVSAYKDDDLMKSIAALTEGNEE